MNRVGNDFVKRHSDCRLPRGSPARHQVIEILDLDGEAGASLTGLGTAIRLTPAFSLHN
jgi:hypothetical protein